MNNVTIRLACQDCDRQDKDPITPEQLEQCKAEGWADIDEVQSYEQSCRTYDNPDDAPAGYEVAAWYTHLGVCPECRKQQWRP
jgi:hypothetical protein